MEKWQEKMRRDSSWHQRGQGGELQRRGKGQKCQVWQRGPVRSEPWRDSWIH